MSKLGTQASQLERYLGREAVEHLSAQMTTWYGPPIAVAGVPGRVFAHAGGDFRGPILGGKFVGAQDIVEGFFRRVKRGLRHAAIKQQMQANTGFAGLSDLIAEMSAGKKTSLQYQKAGATGVVSGTNSLWGLGAMPAAGANASNAPGGDALTDATTGAAGFTNPTNPDTNHYVGGMAQASLANTLLCYDRIFQVNKTMNSTGTEAVTGVPTRYQSTTGGAVDSCEGNFLFPEIGGTALAATAHNWTVCTYTDNANNATQTLPTITGNSSGIVRRLDLPLGQWFAPLATGDTGIKLLSQMQCSALVATGVVNFVIGHPIAWMPVPLVNVACLFDGVNTAISLQRIFDDAALAFLEVCKPATTATNYNMQIDFAAG